MIDLKITAVAENTGAQVAFEEVYRTHFRLVWRILRRLGVRDADLMDLTQDVFLVVHRQLGGFEGRAQLTTWLFTICRRVAKDYLRSAVVRREVPVDVRELARSLSAGVDAVEHLDRTDLSRLLEAILAGMSEKLRLVFVMFEIDEMSGDEISQVLGIPVGTVRSRLNAARAEFQAEVGKVRRAWAEGGSILVPATKVRSF